MNRNEARIWGSYGQEMSREGLRLTDVEYGEAREVMRRYMREGYEESVAFGKSLASIERLKEAWMAKALSGEARRNGKLLDEKKMGKLFLKWKRPCERLPGDEAFRQVTKFLRP